MTDEPTPRPDSDEIDDNLRFAPSAEEVVEQTGDDVEAAESEPAAASDRVPDEEVAAAPDVDLDAALAAISALDDVLAEQEAAEQAEIERQRAEEQARQERQARLQHPEQFFPMPSMTVMQRGRVDSVVPALALIGIGAWLTFALTSGAALTPAILIPAFCAALAVVLLARWLASGRWSLGVFFFALVLLLDGGILLYLLAQDNLIAGWPLLVAGPGLAFLITGLIAGESRLMFPGLVIAASSLVGLLATTNALPDTALSTLAALWPAAVGAVIVLLILPLVIRRS